ncbi:MAG: hypothetical protein AAFV80_23490 [Bacteroidota bacterium]
MSPLYVNIQPEMGQLDCPLHWRVGLKNLIDYLDRKSTGFFDTAGISVQTMHQKIESGSLEAWQDAYRLFIHFQQAEELEELTDRHSIVKLQFPSIDLWPFFRVCFLDDKAQIGFLSEYFSTYLVNQIDEIKDQELENWTVLWQSRAHYYEDHLALVEFDQLKLSFMR